MLDPSTGRVRTRRRGRLSSSEPRIPFISNVTGRWITNAEATDPAYWARHLNHTARFNDALHSLWQMENPLLLEAGPGKTLGVLAMQHPARPAAENAAPISSLRHHYENLPDQEHFLNSVGRLWLAGANIHWNKLRGDQPRRKIPLPTYPFERQNYWLEPEALSPKAEIPLASAPSVQTGIDDWFYAPSWRRTVCQINSDIGLAGALWVVMAERPEHATAFQELLASRGATAEFVRLGEQFECRSGGSLEIDRANPDDYLRLFREIKTKSYDAIHIIHLGCAAESLSCANLKKEHQSCQDIAEQPRRDSAGEHQRCADKPAQRGGGGVRDKRDGGAGREGNALGRDRIIPSSERATQYAQPDPATKSTTSPESRGATQTLQRPFDQNLGFFSLLYIAQAIGELTSPLQSRSASSRANCTM